MNITILIYLLVNSLCYVMGQDLRQSQEFIFQMSSLVLIMSSLLFQPKKYKVSIFEDKLNFCIFAFLVWTVCVFLKDKMGWSILLNTFLGLGVYLTAIRNLDYKDVYFIIKNSLWIVAFAIGYMVLQFLGYDMRGYGLRDVVNGVPHCSIFGLEAHYGLYLSMMFPLLLGISFINRNMGTRVLHIAGILAFIALLFLALIPAQSTGAYLALLVAVLVYLWHRARLTFWVAIVPVLAGFVAFLVIVDNPMGMQKTRFDMWGKVIQDSHKKPLGRGLDAFRLDERDDAIKYFKYSFSDTTVRVKKVSGQWMVTNEVPKEFLDKVNDKKNPLDFWDNAHNFYIQLLFELGFPAIILLGFIMFFIYKMFRFSMKKPITVALYCSILAIAVGSLVQFSFYVARLAHVIPVIAGMFIVSARDECS